MSEEEVPIPTIGRAERKLWAMVMLQAMKDLMGKGPGAPSSYRMSYKDMLRESSLFWIRSNEHYVGSFMYVCEVLGIDPACTRGKLLHISEVRKWRKGREGNSSKRMPD